MSRVVDLLNRGKMVIYRRYQCLLCMLGTTPRHGIECLPASEMVQQQSVLTSRLLLSQRQHGQVAVCICLADTVSAVLRLVDHDTSSAVEAIIIPIGDKPDRYEDAPPPAHACMPTCGKSRR
jgi:hypothetical protein